MQTTLRIDDQVFRGAKAEAARQGVTLTRFIEEALRARLQGAADADRGDEIAARNALMEELLRATAHFRIGKVPTREEMHER